MAPRQPVPPHTAKTTEARRSAEARFSFHVIEKGGAEQPCRSTPSALEFAQDLAQRRALIFGTHRARLLKRRNDAVDQIWQLAVVT